MEKSQIGTWWERNDKRVAWAIALYLFTSNQSLKTDYNKELNERKVWQTKYISHMENEAEAKAHIRDRQQQITDSLEIIRIKRDTNNKNQAKNE